MGLHPIKKFLNSKRNYKVKKTDYRMEKVLSNCLYPEYKKNSKNLTPKNQISQSIMGKLIEESLPKEAVQMANICMKNFQHL